MRIVISHAYYRAMYVAQLWGHHFEMLVAPLVTCENALSPFLRDLRAE